jgi:hypothetical protein
MYLDIRWINGCPTDLEGLSGRISCTPSGPALLTSNFHQSSGILNPPKSAEISSEIFIKT